MTQEINKLLITQDAAQDPLTLRVLERLRAKNKGLQVEKIDSSNDPLRSLSEKDPVSGFEQGKRQLMLTRYKGEWLRACPGTSQHVCCNLWTVNPGEGCPLDCTYCYLQTYLKRNPTLKLYTNTDEMLAAIESRAKEEPNRSFRIGTGEVIDSLVFDDLTDSTHELVPFFARIDNAALELKTKTANVENLLLLKNEHLGKTVVSWSMNAREITDKDEAGTASFDERLDAAVRVQQAGYRVGIHLDPLIHFEGWEEAYKKTVRDIFTTLDKNLLAWVSVSTLRYKPDMQLTMEERFSESKLPYGEQFLAKDGKMRYLQALRFKLVKSVWNEIKKVDEDIPAYMCMESSQAWKTIAGGSPAQGQELREVFARSNQSVATDSSGAVQGKSRLAVVHN